MRFIGRCAIAIALLFPLTPALAAERGSVIQAGDLKAKPFIDAPAAAKVGANQQVNILSRQGAWVQVEAGGQTGWIRMLNLRMEASAGGQPGGKPPAKRGGLSAASLFTGSSGKTTTTGVKGLGEEDIRNASVNYAELQRLGALAVAPNEASANAQRNGLKETKVAYLEKGDGK